MNTKPILITCLLICFVLSVSFVSASDLDNNLTTSDSGVDQNVLQTEDDASQENLQVTEGNTLKKTTEDNVLRDDPGTFTELDALINNESVQEGNVVLLEKDYAYVEGDGDTLKFGICIIKNITIDGQGHTINGSNLARIFAVGYNGHDHQAVGNVILKNINFVNAFNDVATDKNDAFGAVEFHGGGAIDNCNFSNNKAHCAAAIAWGTATNANITNCVFTNNTGYGTGGGAIRFRTNMVNINIENCTFIDNYADSYGGAVHTAANANSDMVTVYNCTFINNTARQGGAALFFSTPDTVVNKSRFVNNSAPKGGAIYWEGDTGRLYNSNFTNNNATLGGSIFYLGDNCLVDNCIFTNNSAITLGSTQGKGGAVYANHTGSTFYNGTAFSHCTFNNNSATADGGALYFYLSGNVTDCNFTDNHAGDYAGAIYFKYIGVVNSSNFTNNIADKGNGAIYFSDPGSVDNSNFIHNIAKEGNGGAIYFKRSGNVTDSTFINNSATNGGGGAIRFNSTANVSGCIFINNTISLPAIATSGGGGAIYFDKDGNVDNCNFTNNSESGGLGGGAIYFGASTGVVTRSNFNGSRASPSRSAQLNDGGGAIFFIGEGIVDNCNFTDNFVFNTCGGGAIFFTNFGLVNNSNFHKNALVNDSQGGGAIYFGSSGAIDNCNFTNNTVPNNNGGAIYAISTSGNIDINNSNFIFNTANHGGGALHMHNSNIYNSNFTNNTAYGGSGGAVSVNNVNMSNCNFDNNAVNSQHGGGAIFVGSDTGTGTPTGNITNCIFTNNYAGSHGGAVALAYGIVSNCNFTNNNARGGGGAVQLENPSATVDNCNFINNKAISESATGGAVCGKGNVFNSNFTYNSAENNVGGAISLGSGNVINCSLINNDAGSHGGAVHLSSGTVDNCNFINNTVKRDDRHGGAIYIVAGDVKNSNFTNNSAQGSGGAIYVYTSGSVDNCVFVNNSAYAPSSGGNAVGGGAIFINRGEVSNSNFTNNTATRYGGAILFKGAGTVDNCNFTNNSAYRGGAAYFTNMASVDNSNFTYNHATIGSAICFTAYYSKSVKNSVLLNNKADASYLTITRNSNKINMVFTGKDNLINAIDSSSDVDFENVTFWGVSGVENTGTQTISPSDNEAGINLTVQVTHNGSTEEMTMVTGVNGNVSFEVTEPGPYTIKAYHYDDSYYTEKASYTTTFTLYETTTNLDIIDFTAQASIIPYLATGYVTFTVTNESGVVKEETVRISNSWRDAIAKLDLSDLEFGKYNITAVYNGDENYLPSNNTTSIELKPLNSTIIIYTHNIRVGETEEIWFDINEDEYKDAIVYVNGTKYDAYQGELILNNLPEGRYIVEVYYAGDDLYLPAHNSSAFGVVEDIEYYVTAHNKTATINVPVNITADSNIKHDILNGTMFFTLYELYDGQEYYIDDVEATLSDDGIWWTEYTFDTYFDERSVIRVEPEYESFDGVTVHEGYINIRWGIPFNITAEDVDYGTKVNVTINFAEPDAAGNITFFIGDKNYTLENFAVSPNSYIIPDILAAGDYTITAVYSGDYYYASNTSTTNFTVHRAKPTIIINASDIVVDNNAIINATLPENATGKIILIVNDVEYEVESGESISVPNLSVGTYEVVAIYNGDGNFTHAHAHKSFNVIKRNITVTLDEITDPIYVDSPVTFTARLNETVTGDVIFTINGANHTVVITNSNFATFEYTPANNASLNVVATFAGNSKFNSNKSSPLDLTVNGIPTNITVSFDSPILVGDEARITVRLNASIDTTVKLKVGHSVRNVAIIGGVGEYATSNLMNDTYDIVATFEGNDRYAGSVSATKTLKVNKIPTNVTISVDKNPINVGENVIVGIVLNQTLNTTVIVRVNNNNYTVGMVNGRGNLTLSGLANDTFAIVAEYAGDSKHLGNTSNTITLKVNKVATEITVSANSPKVGENAVMTINMNPLINAAVKLRVAGKTYYVAVVNGVGTYNVSGLAQNSYDVNVTFEGDSKYLYSTNNTTLVVSKVDYQINVTPEDIVFGDNETITVVLPADINPANLVIKVDGDVKTPASVINGVATVIVPGLPVGQHEVNVTYTGDGKYDAKDNNSNMFTVSPSKINEIGLGVDNKTYGEVTTFTVTLHAGVTENVTITIDGVDYSRKPNDAGTATLTLNNLSGGLHAVTATYPGDSNYSANSTSAVFTIARAATSIDVDFTTPKSVGDDVLVDVTMPQKINGTVILRVGTQNYTVSITDGVGSYVVSGLTNATYDVEAEFEGNRNYSGGVSQIKQLEINKIPTAIVVAVNETINVGQVAVVNVTVDKKLNGSVIVTVNGENHTVAIIDGKGTLTLAGLANATYTINATFKGDDKYVNSTSNTATLKVNRIATAIVVSAGPNINVGDTAVVAITMDPTINATVKLKVGGETYDVAVVNGVGTYNVSGLAYGPYDVNVTFEGNYKYSYATNNTTLMVNRISDYTINVTTEDIPFGDDETIAVVLPADIDPAKIVIKVDGDVKTPVSVINGIATVIVPGLPAGQHEVNVTYTGDDKYEAKDNNSNMFTVSPSTVNSITLDVDNRTYGEDTTFKVTLNPGVTENVTITIDGVDYSRKPDANGVATLTLNNLSGGLHAVTASYPGDGSYSANSTSSVFTIARAATSIDVDFTTPQSVGDDVLIDVIMPQKINGTVILRVGTQNYTVSITDGVGSYLVPGLANATYDVEAEFEGNRNYSGSVSQIKQLEINKVPTTVVVAVNETINVGQVAVVNVTIDKKLNGSVIVTVNGENHTVAIIDGKGTLTLAGLANATYLINATFKGDGKYVNSTSNTATLKVNKVDSTVSVKADNITVGDKAVIRITVPVDATGNVTTVIVDGEAYYVPVANGTGILVVPGLVVGNYTVEVTYNGDGRYKQSATNSTVFAVNKIKSEIVVVDQGNGTVVVVIGGNATGDVNITVGNNTYNGTVINGTAVVTLDNETPGEHDITVIYSGDDIRTNATADATISILKAAPSISVDVSNIYVGDVALINVTLPSNAGGTVTIEINGIEYQPDDFAGGIARFSVENLAFGNKTVAVKYSGDANYTAISTTANFTVFKRNSQVNVTGDIITVGENATVSVVLATNATGYVVVKVNGQNYTINLTNGQGSVDIPGLKNTTYSVDVVYLGDDQYKSSTNSTEIKVNKVESAVSVKADNITVGDKAVIEITVPADATGNVTTVIVGGKTYHVPVANGTGILVVHGLAVGNYTVNVIYNGDDRYERSVQNSTVFSVNKVTVEDDEIKVIDQGNGTVVVVVPGNATGNVTVEVGNNTYNATVINGTAIVQINNETPGVHNITVIYSGDTNHTNATVNATVSIPKLMTPINVDVSNLKVGDVEIITVSLPGNATGNVTVEINGIIKTEKIVGGNATFRFENLTYGMKTAYVNYIGDDTYMGNHTSARFEVDKRNSYINLDVNATVVGKDAFINVTIPSNATGFVIVQVGNQTYAINTTLGKGSVTLKGLGNETYHVVATYLGDDQYYSSGNATDFTLDKVPSSVAVSVDNITVGDKAIIRITVPVDATGNVTTLIVIGETYHVPVANGTGILVVPGLAVGNYTVEVVYNGDGKYEQSARNSTMFSVNKVVTTPDDIKVIDQGNGTVVVVVPGNATGNVTVVVGNNTYNATVINGTAVITIDNETPGEHNITVIYSGDDTHTNATVNATVNIDKMFTPICVDVANIYVGDKAFINVTMPNGAKGNVTIEIDGVEYSAKIIDDVARFAVENLTAGIKTVAVTYIGDANYTANFTTANFTVMKRDITITVNADDIDVGEAAIINVTAPVDVTRPVLVEVDGVGYYVNITADGKGQLVIPDIGAGVHNITARYLGDDKYSNASDTDDFTASKIDSFVSVKVENITVGDKAVIEITVPGDATGNVTTVIVNGRTYYVPVANGTGILVVPGLDVGDYTVNVVYNGDEKYKQSARNSTVFSVNKLITTPDDVKVIDQGNGTVVVVVPGNATGNVTVVVGNNTYNATVINGTAVITIDNETPGEHNITVIYSGDDTHTNVTVNATVNIDKMFTPIGVDVANIYVGDKALINVTMPKGAKGNVTIEIDGVEYSAKIIDDVARFVVENLTAGIKTVAVTYIGDNNYTANFTTANFTVMKRDITITVNADDISVGEDVTIDVTAPSDVTRPVLVDVDGVGYYVNITGGKGRLILPDIGSGVHDITAIYLGDDKYSNASATDNFTASKVDSFVKVKVENITVGDKAVIEITVPGDATGNVTTVIVNGKTYYVPVTNGTGILVVPGLDVGDYTVNVVYNGDEKYKQSARNSTVFSVNKLITTPDDIKVIDQGNGTVVVVVPGNATGNVTVVVGNNTYNATVINGTAVITIDNETPGEHNITVIYSGDDTHTNVTVNATVNINKMFTPIGVDVSNIYVGDKAFINVTMPNGAKGNVTIEIDGVEYSAKIIGDVARFAVENLTAGIKTVAVTYIGDNNYTANFTTANFTVMKRDVTITVNADDISVGEALTINVTAPVDVTRPVLVEVDGVGYYVNITADGKGQLVIPDIGAGVHNITARYLGDDKYSNASAKDNFTASKVDSFVSVKVENITVGDKAVIEITVPGDATGNVTTVIVNGKIYHVPVANGTGILVVSGLDVGDYTVNVVYNGDDKYKPSAQNTTEFSVNNVITTANDIKVVDQGNGTVVVVVPGNATGNVTIEVGDHTYNGTVINGTAVITIDNETPGEHNITVIYSGDDTHTNATVNSTVNINKMFTPMIVDVASIYVGDKAFINVTMPKGAKGNVTIEIDGVEYSAKIIDDVARFTIENLTAGIKTAAVTYIGDDNYTANFTTAKFTVSKRGSTVNATVESIMAGYNVTIKVNVTSGATGQVLIDIDGIGYYVNLTGSVGEISIPNFKEGKHDINVTYVGDDKYLSNSTVADFTVTKHTPFVIPTAHDIIVGETEFITFKVPTNATGNLTVVIDGEEYTFILNQGTLGVAYSEGAKYTVAISGGNGELAVIGLPRGEYVVSVKYNGDDKYAQVDNTTTFRVTARDTQMYVHDLGNGTVVVELDDYNTTGNVTVVIEGNTYVANVTNGTAVVNIDNLPPGTYNANVTYSGDTSHNPQSVNASVTIPKHSTPVSVTAHDIYVGDTETVTVSLPKGATGVVTIEINGKKYATNANDGKAVFHVTGLAFGSKTVAVKYEGDRNYEGNYTTGKFEVYKRPSTVTAKGKNIKAGADEVITANVPGDATGKVLVKIGNVGYYGTIVNGVAKVIIPDLPSGTYKATVIYEGDDKYLPSSTTVSFKVTKSKTPISATGDEINVGEDGTVSVKVPNKATGKVTIKVNGKTYTAKVKNGKATFKVSGLKKGTYPVKVKYPSDRYFAANSTTTRIIVHDDVHPNNGSGNASAKHHAQAGVALTNHVTANPIWILVMVICTIVVGRMRRFRK